MKISKLSYVLIALLLGLTSMMAQKKMDHLKKINDTLTLDQRQFVVIDDLKSILNQLKSAPIIEMDCPELSCSKISAYSDVLYNLGQDIDIYYQAVNSSTNIYKNQWYNYLNQNINNERLKMAMVTMLGIKDYWAGVSSFLLDLTAVMSSLQSGEAVNPNTMAIALRALNDLDAVMGKLNLFFKAATGDSGTGFISQATSDTWDNVYGTMKGSLDASLEAINHYKKVSKATEGIINKKGYLNKAFYKAKSVKVNRANMANIASAIAALLNVYSNVERNQMKKVIADLDKVLGPNQHVQSGYYQLYKLQLRLLDEMRKIKRQLGPLASLTYYNRQICAGGLVNRFQREEVLVDEGTFGKALFYYKEILTQTAKTMSASWSGLEQCNSDQLGSYEFMVYDGTGKNIQVDIGVVSNWSKMHKYNGLSNNPNPVKLYPGKYNINILGENQFGKLRRHSVQLDGFQITGKEAEEFRLNPTGGDSTRIVHIKPYGRLELLVVDMDNKPTEFGFALRNASNQPIIEGRSYNQMESIDIPANENFTVSLDYGFSQHFSSAVTIGSTKTKRLKFVYDNDGKFKESFDLEEGPKLEEEFKSPYEAAKQLKNIPPKWAKGVLINSNDTDCQYGGKYLIFSNQGGELMNLETGKISESVIVAPGAQVAVAAPEEAAFIRAFLANGPYNVESKGNRIAFGLLNDLLDGWWFSAGCKEGTKPKTNCNNGRGEVGTGSACKTLGED